jgi:hypothetical protein
LFIESVCTPSAYKSKVVEDSSSALDYAYEQKYCINANHVNMCRFSGFEDDGYKNLRDCLSLCLEDLEKGDKQRTLNKDGFRVY